MTSNDEPKSFNSAHKLVIREKWNEPLLKFLAKRSNDKLVYMGLPSGKAEDVLSWIDYIKVVIAFQCRKYGDVSNQDQSREEIEKLEEILRGLERQRKLDYFVVYDGYLEEVVLRGKDNSPSRIDFGQDSVITLYNLDFCNKVSSPLEYIDAKGEPKTAYKFDAIKKLLRIQEGISNVSDKFIFLLTVHCSYDGKELKDFINKPPDAVKPYFEKYTELPKGHEKSSRIVRLFVVYLIHTYFIAHGFAYKILPVIRYNGLENTPLLHFVVMAIRAEPTAGLISNQQQMEEVLDLKFISFDSDKIVNLESSLDELDVEIVSSVDFFSRSQTFQKLWQAS